MSASNSNWRASAAIATGAALLNTTERRGNLAMTGELALGGQCMPSYGAGVSSSIVPRQRGGGVGVTTSNESKDIFGSIMNKPTQSSASNNGFSDFEGGAKNSVSGRFYNNQNSTGINSSSDYSLMQNNNITNMYSKPICNNSNNTDTLSYFNLNSNRVSVCETGNQPDSSQGFKVQRIRGGNQVQSNIMALNGSSNYNIARTSIKDENIDTSTWKVKQEIDQIDEKLSIKQQTSQGDVKQNQQQNTGFGLNSLAHGNQKQQNSENIMNGGVIGETQSSNSGFSGSFLKPIGFNLKGISGNNENTLNNQQQQGYSQEIEESSSAVVASGPFKKILSNPVLMGTNGAAKSTEISNATKEFQTGTYDPSNILGGTRQGRMRSQGRGKDKTAGNQHEEKAAQATGNKLLPEQIAVETQFECPEGCGRSFNKKALEKHIPLCKKVFVPKKTTTNESIKQSISSGVSVKTDSKKESAKAPSKLPPKQPQQLEQQQVKNKTTAASKPQEQGLQTAKNEALRKLKEQKKKEIAESNKAIQQEKDEEDRNVIDDNQNDGQDYL